MDIRELVRSSEVDFNLRLLLQSELVKVDIRELVSIPFNVSRETISLNTLKA